LMISILTAPMSQLLKLYLEMVSTKLKLPELSAVNIQWQNGLRSHQWRLDAKPPADWGQPFQI